ncbi:hypothetical protein [Ralstonia thomasii]
MATNIRSRIEKLELRNGGREPLIVVITRFDVGQERAGAVRLNGDLHKCKRGQNTEDLQKQLINDIERRRLSGLFVVEQVSDLRNDGDAV